MSVTPEEALRALQWLSGKKIGDYAVIYREANGDLNSLFLGTEMVAKRRARSLDGIIFRQVISYEPLEEGEDK